jgi:hypothetical protein
VPSSRCRSGPLGLEIFKALHILSMFAMVVVFSGGELFFAMAIRRREVHALAWLHRLRRPLGIAAFGWLVAGIAFGLLTAATGGLDFFAGWLIAAYLLIGLFFVNGALNERVVRQLGVAAVEAEAGRRPADEVVREMAATNRPTVLLVVNAVIFAALILDMVLKPF